MLAAGIGGANFGFGLLERGIVFAGKCLKLLEGEELGLGGGLGAAHLRVVGFDRRNVAVMVFAGLLLGGRHLHWLLGA